MPYKHKLSPRVLDEGSTEPLPEPYERLRGAKIHSPRWGNGWLGVESVGDHVVVWHVSEDMTCQPLNFEDVHAVVDPKTGDVWLIFSGTTKSHLFLLWPEEALSLKHIPDAVRRVLWEGEHE